MKVRVIIGIQNLISIQVCHTCDWIIKLINRVSRIAKYPLVAFRIKYFKVFHYITGVISLGFYVPLFGLIKDIAGISGQLDKPYSIKHKRVIVIQTDTLRLAVIIDGLSSP